MPRLKKGTFSIFPYEIARGLPPLQQTILFWLWNHANNGTKTCFPSYTTLALESGCSRRSAITAIKGLDKNKRISVVCRRISEKKNKTNLYTVHLASEISALGGEIFAPQVVQNLHPELNTVELNKQNQTKINTLAKASVEHIVYFLFSSTTLKELESKIERELPKDWDMSWQQTLSASFGHFKTVELIWERSRQLLDLEAVAPQGEKPPLLRGSLNYIDKAIRSGVSFDKIKEHIEKYGWKKFKYDYSNDVLDEY